MIDCRRLGLVVFILVGVSGCRFNLSNTNTDNDATTLTNPAAPTPTPAPATTTVPPTSPASTPGQQSTGGRTPDPPNGSVLPFPTYTAQVVNAYRADASQACTSYTYLDGLVDTLRLRDTRWGYVCSAAGCSVPSMDKIGYHATAGPEVSGAQGVWFVDVIFDVCGINDPRFVGAGYEPLLGWTTRGRF